MRSNPSLPEMIKYKKISSKSYQIMISITFILLHNYTLMTTWRESLGPCPHQQNTNRNTNTNICTNTNTSTNTNLSRIARSLSSSALGDGGALSVLDSSSILRKLLFSILCEESKLVCSPWVEAS